MLKVVFSLPSGFLMSGVTTWSVDMVKEISRRGHSSILVKHTCYPGYKELAFHNQAELNLVPCPGETPFSIQDIDVLQQYAALYRSLAPAVFVPNWSPAIYAVCAALTREIPESLRIIGYAHSDESYYYDTLQYYEPIVHKFVAVSEEIKKRLIQIIPKRSRDIIFRPYPVHLNRKLFRTYTPSSQSLKVVYAGRLSSRQKRIFDLVTLVLKLAQCNVNFHLSIYGDGPEEDQLKQSISALDPAINNCVTFHGMVSPADMQDVWHTSDVCILVSDFEGMSLSMLEAMANGCVPVVTQVSGTSSVIQDGYNGFLIEVGNMDAMAQRIQILAHQRDQLIAMGNCARTAITREYSYNHYITWFLALCEEIQQQPALTWPIERSIYLSHRSR